MNSVGPIGANFFQGAELFAIGLSVVLAILWSVVRIHDRLTGYPNPAEIDSAVLNAIASLGEGSGNEILGLVETRLQRKIGTGALHVVLRDLIERGYVETRREENDGSRPRRTFYRLTDSGRGHRIHAAQGTTSNASAAPGTQGANI